MYKRGVYYLTSYFFCFREACKGGNNGFNNFPPSLDPLSLLVNLATNLVANTISNLGNQFDRNRPFYGRIRRSANATLMNLTIAE